MKKIFFLFAFIYANLLFAQTQKIGFVSSAKILDELPETKGAEEKLNQLSQLWQNEMDEISQEYQTKLEDYQKQQSMLNDETKKQKEQELMTLQEAYQKIRQDKFSNGGELDQEKEKLLNPIKEKILNAIKSVAKEQGMSFVFDKNDQVNFLLYGDDTYDITYDVISKLKKSK